MTEQQQRPDTQWWEMLSTRQEEQSFTPSATGVKSRLLSGEDQLVIAGEPQAISKVIMNPLLGFLIGKFISHAMPHLEDGMILICLKLETD